jgi:enoyl-CoA hydratase/carnithine racemase
LGISRHVFHLTPLQVTLARVPFRTSPVVAEDEWELRLEIVDGIAILTLDKPDKLNAWSWETSRQLGARADQIRFDERVRAVVIRANGRAFCAGVDLGMPEDRVTGRTNAEKVRNYYEGIRWVHERFRVFAELPQPTVVAVQGYCLGFGFELALMADIRIAAADAVFALPEAQVGVAIDAGGDLRLAHEVGTGWAKLLALTGRRIDAATAERLGIVQQVVDRDALDDTAMGIAQEIARNAPLAVQSIKRSIDNWSWRGMPDALRFSIMSAAVEFISDDMPAGYAAKAAKQPVQFEGK